MIFYLFLALTSKSVPLIFPQGEFISLTFAEAVAWFGEILSYGIALVYLLVFWPSSWWLFRMRSPSEAALGGFVVGVVVALLVFPCDLLHTFAANADATNQLFLLGIVSSAGVWAPLALLSLAKGLLVLASLGQGKPKCRVSERR